MVKKSSEHILKILKHDCAIVFEPYLILYDKNNEVQILRLEETGIRKLFQDKASKDW
jgi:hypothetical protein